MKVNIEGNLYLESDGMQFILKDYTGKIYTDKRGNVTEAHNTLGYFPSVQSAMRHLVKMKLMESTATTLNELLQDVQRIEEYIESRVSV